MIDYLTEAKRRARHARLVKKNPGLMTALYGETPSYTCPRCGAISHNPNDLRERYCGACHKFEDEGK